MNDSSLPRVLSVIGARPEIIQAARVSAAFEGLVNEILVHTGQHYDEKMSEGQIIATRLPRPDHNLAVGSLPPAEQVGLAQRRLSELIERERPDAVLVRGDTNATLSGARAASQAGVPLIHVEAGLRSPRMDMPEESNRIETDRLSDLLLRADRGRAGQPSERGRSGSRSMSRAIRSATCSSPGATAIAPACAASTCWRPSTATTTPTTPSACARCSTASAAPRAGSSSRVHPRTAARMESWKLAVPANVELIEPVPYTRMLELERGAWAIATDSGGVQREAYLWGVPA